MAVVYGLILVAVYLFISDGLAIDITAILIMVLLMLLEPWTQISPAEAISGFSNPATITVLAMLILSGGLIKTGLAQIIGHKLAEFAGKNKFKQLFATIAAGGPISGLVNNTPVGYQTNLFVYGPGGYRFSDYVRIGAPLQLILSVVTVGGIVLFWGL